MPERNRHNSSSHHHEPSSLRNNGIYIVGDTKIIVQNSGSMGCDVILTPGAEKTGGFNTALFFLRHPRRFLTNIRHHMQKDGALLTCGCGTETIKYYDAPHERKPHASSGSGSLCLNTNTDDGRTDTGDNKTEKGNSRRHRRRSSHRRRARSSSASTQRHHDQVSALPAPHLGTIGAPAIIQQVHVMNGDVRGATLAEQQSCSQSGRPGAPRHRAVNSYAPIAEGLPIPDHESAQPVAYRSNHLKNDKNDGKTSTRDNEVETASRHGRRRRSSRRSRGRSSPDSTQRRHNERQPLPPLHLSITNMQAQNKSSSQSRRSSIQPPRAVFPHAPIPEDLQVPDCGYAQSIAHDDPRSQDQQQENILDRFQEPVKSYRILPSSASHTSRVTENPWTSLEPR